MKITVLIARILLGLAFTVFGANGLHPFLPTPPPPGGLAGQYIDALFQSHYAVVVFLVQLIAAYCCSRTAMFPWPWQSSDRCS